MNNKSILFNRGIVTVILVLIMFILSASVANARRTESGMTPPSDYHENAIRRFEIVSLISLPFTAIHSYLTFRGVEIIRQRKFSPDISDDDYKIIGGMAVTFSAFIGFWDWYHTRGKDTSQPKIQTRKARKSAAEYTAREPAPHFSAVSTKPTKTRKEWIAQDLSRESDILSATEHSLNDNAIVVHLYQIKF